MLWKVLERNRLRRNGRDRDRTDDLYRVKVFETVYLVGSSRFLLLLNDAELRYSAQNWSQIGRRASARLIFSDSRCGTLALILESDFDFLRAFFQPFSLAFSRFCVLFGLSCPRFAH